jgi:hypothetical protein
MGGLPVWGLDKVLTTDTKSWSYYKMDAFASGLDLSFVTTLALRKGHEIWYKQGDALSSLLFNLALEYTIRRCSGKPGWLEIKWYTSASGVC